MAGLDLILGNDKNSDYKYAILVLETQHFSCCLLHFIKSYLGIYLKTKKQKKQQQKKTATQIRKQNKTKKKKKKEEEGKKKVVNRI